MTITEYAEKVLGIKLYAYQKEFIKKIETNHKPQAPQIIPKSVMQCGLKHTSIFIDENLLGKKVNNIG